MEITAKASEIKNICLNFRDLTLGEAWNRS
jgi:hypothetical protein